MFLFSSIKTHAKTFLITVFVCSLGAFSDSFVFGQVPVVADGKKVTLQYTLHVQGEASTASDESSTFTYIHGAHEIIPGLEKALKGMSVNAQKTVNVPPAEAYGERTADALREIPKTDLPDDGELFVGKKFLIESQEKEEYVVSLAEIKKDTVVVDFNHPLAGKALTFTVKILRVE